MSELSHRYAAALYETGVEEAALSDVSAMLQGDEALWNALQSPIIRKPEKIAVLQGLSAQIADARLLAFLCLLIEKSRMAILSDILASFRALVLKNRYGAQCLVTCVHIPTAQQQDMICQMLREKHEKDYITLDFQLESALLGGFILEIEGITYDQSIRGRLLGLSRYLEGVKLT